MQRASTKELFYVFEVLDRLKLHDDGLLDEQIQDMLSHRDAIVENFDLNLRFHGNGGTA